MPIYVDPITGKIVNIPSGVFPVGLNVLSKVTLNMNTLDDQEIVLGDRGLPIGIIMTNMISEAPTVLETLTMSTASMPLGGFLFEIGKTIRGVTSLSEGVILDIQTDNFFSFYRIIIGEASGVFTLTEHIIQTDKIGNPNYNMVLVADSIDPFVGFSDGEIWDEQGRSGIQVIQGATEQYFGTLTTPDSYLLDISVTKTNGLFVNSIYYTNGVVQGIPSTCDIYVLGITLPS